MNYLAHHVRGMSCKPQVDELKRLIDRYRYKEAKALAANIREFIKEQSHE